MAARRDSKKIQAQEKESLDRQLGVLFGIVHFLSHLNFLTDGKFGPWTQWSPCTAKCTDEKGDSVRTF
jgi:hypothetical protein